MVDRSQLTELLLPHTHLSVIPSASLPSPSPSLALSTSRRPSFPPSLSSYPSHFFPVSNQISCAPYGFCPLWVRRNGSKRGSEVRVWTRASDGAAASRCFPLLYPSERHTVCLSPADARPTFRDIVIKRFCAFERMCACVFCEIN